MSEVSNKKNGEKLLQQLHLYYLQLYSQLLLL